MGGFIPMKVTRRTFLKGSAAAAFAAAFGCTTKDRPYVAGVDHWQRPFRLKSGHETTTICCFCGCGCGAIVTSNEVNGAVKIVNIEGDPDHPVNQGALCSKGAALAQIPNQPDFELAREPSGNNGARLVRPLKRVAGSTAWQEIPWATAINEIGQAIKTTRASGFVHQDGSSRVVNRVENLYNLGGASLDTEECYLLSKMLRGLGVVYMEHQARI